VSGVEAGRAGRSAAADAAEFWENVEVENGVTEEKAEDPAMGKGDVVKGEGPACAGAEFCPCSWKGLDWLPIPNGEEATPIDCATNMLCRNGFDPVG
jgi:hypothetical protein